jgi:hypothetical protein
MWGFQEFPSVKKSHFYPVSGEVLVTQRMPATSFSSSDVS